MLEALSFELGRLADQLEETPRDHEAVLLLGEITSYLADYTPACHPIALQISRMTERAAANLVCAVKHDVCVVSVTY